MPLLVKIAPDLDPEERADIAAVALASGIDGIIVVEHHGGAAAGAAQPTGARGRRAQRPAAIRAIDRTACAKCIG